MTSRDSLPNAAKGRSSDHVQLPGLVVLVLQGGGAQGCYQAGAYEALHEAGIEPDWVIGTSIGALNGAIIAGNRVVHRLERLREFWAHFETRLPEPWSQLKALLGVRGFYHLNPAVAWGVETKVGIERAGLYCVDPLKKLLPDLVDFNLVNRGKPRFTLGLVGVRSGEMRYFDSKTETIGLEHVLGSSAIPPSFPAVRIARESYWDGGIYSKYPGRSGIRRRAPHVFRRLRRADLARARTRARIHCAGLHAREGHSIRFQEPYRAAGPDSSDASRRPRTRQHASRRMQACA